jgi:hypothetical protein
MNRLRSLWARSELQMGSRPTKELEQEGGAHVV